MYSRFKHLADLKGVTPYRVAKDTGVNTATFTTWKNGKHTPTLETLKKIAEYFNVPVAYFYEEDDDNIDSQLLDVAVTHLSSNLREDQRHIIKTAASLTQEEVVIVDTLIRALKDMTPGEIKIIKAFVTSLVESEDE